MSKIYIYLAGPITGKSAQSAVQWRELIGNALEGACENFVSISPLRCESPNEDGMYPVEYEWAFAHEVTEKNKLDVQRCDAVLAYLPDGNPLSIGTILEIGWARGMGKPVILVTNSDMVLNHPIIMADVPFRFDTRDKGWKKAVNTLKGLFEVYA